MSPASRREFEILTECKLKIAYLEGSLKELRSELSERRKEKKSEKERISDRRLTIYLAIASISTVALLKTVEWIGSLL